MKNTMNRLQLIVVSLLYCAVSVSIISQPVTAKGHPHPHPHAKPEHHTKPHPDPESHKSAADHRKEHHKGEAQHKREERQRRAEAEHRKEADRRLAKAEHKPEFGHGPAICSPHQSRAEVLGRDKHLLNEIGHDRRGLGKNFDRLQNDAKAIRLQEQADSRKNGGHITKGEQRQLNREENALQRETAMDRTNSFARRHPRRAEVLSRSADANFDINQDKGHLKGNYKKLQAEDKSIIRQEQRDARQNGGHITNREQGQLNREENNLDQQFKKDSSR